MVSREAVIKQCLEMLRTPHDAAAVKRKLREVWDYVDLRSDRRVAVLCIAAECTLPNARTEEEIAVLREALRACLKEELSQADVARMLSRMIEVGLELFPSATDPQTLKGGV